MWKKLNIHAVATDKPSFLGRYAGRTWDFVKETPTKDIWDPHHLYLTSNDEIKGGDWFLYSFNDGWILRQADKEPWRGVRRKIIATSNIGILPYYTSRDENDEYTCLHCKQKHIERNAYGTWWTPCKCIQGIIPQSLIQYFVEKQGQVKEVMVEYEKYALTSKAARQEANFQFTPLGKYHGTHGETTKLTPSGEIIWKPVEEKVYTREEVLNILNERWNYTHTDLNPLSIREWFEKYY